MMDLHEQLKDIKTQLRLSMNGAVSQSMREKGLVYKLNFGVELPRIKSIAAAYENVLSRDCRYLGGHHAQQRDCRTYIDESFPAFAVCSGQGFPMDCRRARICTGLRFPDHCPSVVEEGRHDRPRGQ